MDKSCWQWIDWTPCYKIGDTSHGNKVELMGWCPNCSKMRLRGPGYGYNKPLSVLDTPHFDPDFKGAVSLICPACGYSGSFYVDVPSRKVFLVREVCSRGV
ncbi:hypothetical protein ES708_12322 [subsurface metagenome]